MGDVFSETGLKWFDAEGNEITGDIVWGDADGGTVDLIDGKHTRFSIRDGVRTDEVMVEGPETAESWAWHMLRKVYGCDCNRPETAYELVRDVLRLMPLHQGTWEECERLIGSAGAFHIVLDRMTDADLIEHGGSIGGSWMRPEGERLLAILDPVEDFADWADRVEAEHCTWQPTETDEERPIEKVL